MTTNSNATVGKVHDPKFRMPVILDRHEEGLWLSKDIGIAELLTLCDPYPDEQMSAYRVSSAVNKTMIDKSTVNNEAVLMEPLNNL